MTKYILDSSALLAVLLEENGSEKVEKIMGHAVLSVVNFSEIMSKMLLKGLQVVETLDHIKSLIPEIIPFSIPIATKAAELIIYTKTFGLSLGDRACIATAIDYGYEVITADKIWTNIKVPIKITVIR